MPGRCAQGRWLGSRRSSTPDHRSPRHRMPTRYGRFLALPLAALVGLAAPAAMAAKPKKKKAARAVAVTVSPEPGTPDASPTTQISLLGPPKKQIQAVTVRGSRTGRHKGKLRGYSGNRGASFVMPKSFTPGENVRVRVAFKSARAKQWSFTVATPGASTTPPSPVRPGFNPNGALSFVSRPDLHPPSVSVATNSGAARGDIFTAPIGGPPPPGQPPKQIVGLPGPLIHAPNGGLIWSRPLPPGQLAFAFGQQRYLGRPALVWFQGMLSTLGYGEGNFVVYDNSYRQIATIRAGNGYKGDLHEIQLTNRGTAVMTVYPVIAANLTRFGGAAQGTLLESIIQEVDLRTGLVMWEWHNLGHLDFGETYVAPIASPAPLGVSWDPFHVNSVDILSNGNYLVSARNTDSVWEIDKRTGRILWRLGGKRSTYTLGPNVAFAFQHDARLLPNGNISIFDDEAGPPVKPPSRGIIVHIDKRARTASLVQQFLNPSRPIAGSQGNMQSLPGGNWLLGYGSVNEFTEFNSAGTIVFDARFPSPDESYRTFRVPWTATPAQAPAAAVAVSGGGTNLYASWNGATRVAQWQVLTGASASSLSPSGSPVARSGFETVIPTTSPGPLYAVRALDSSGRTLGTSAAVHP